MAVVLRLRGIPWATRHRKEHSIRSLVRALAFSLWVFTIAHLPLATARTLNYTAPLFVALFLALVWFGLTSFATQAKFDGWLYLAIALGFSGVVLLIPFPVQKDIERGWTSRRDSTRGTARRRVRHPRIMSF